MEDVPVGKYRPLSSLDELEDFPLCLRISTDTTEQVFDMRVFRCKSAHSVKELMLYKDDIKKAVSEKRTVRVITRHNEVVFESINGVITSKGKANEETKSTHEQTEAVSLKDSSKGRKAKEKPEAVKTGDDPQSVIVQPVKRKKQIKTRPLVSTHRTA